jgi:hypothetical protein
MLIDDGKGRGFKAEVNAENELVVRSISEPELEHASNMGEAYSWDSQELDIVAGETMLYVRNDGDTPLILDRLDFNGSDVICTWEIGIGSLTTVPAGTIVVGVNMNQVFSTKAAEATAFSDETAVDDAAVLFRVKTAISGHHQHDMTGVILGKNHYVQINQETESNSGSVILIGHFENPS